MGIASSLLSESPRFAPPAQSGSESQSPQPQPQSPQPGIFPSHNCPCGCSIFWQSIYSPDWRCLGCDPHPGRQFVRTIRDLATDPPESPEDESLRDVQVVDYEVPSGKYTLYTRQVGRTAESISWLTCAWFDRRPCEIRRSAVKEASDES